MQPYLKLLILGLSQYTVNSELFARILYSRNFAYAAKFREIKSSRNGKIILSFTDIGKHALVSNFNVANMSYAIRENKILVKISEFTVRPNFL